MSERSSRDKAISRIREQRQKRSDTDTLFERLLTGDREALSLAITEVERDIPEARDRAAKLLEKCLPYSGNARRIGITGVPGVGKSTFIETFGRQLTAAGHKVAVLAIDPTSSRTGGSILGDKTRMNELARDPKAFIRPSAASDTLGGVARATRETIMLCEAAGYDRIIVETVGVGQSETAVHGMVDFFLLLMLAGAGDDLQGIKRGIMEMADGMVITKADGDNILNAERAARQYSNALHLFPPTGNGWAPKVSLTSAVENTGFEALHNILEDFFTEVSASGWMLKNRQRQDLVWLDEAIRFEIRDALHRHPQANTLLESLREQVADRKVSPFAAARALLDFWLNGSATEK